MLRLRGKRRQKMLKKLEMKQELLEIEPKKHDKNRRLRQHASSTSGAWELQNEHINRVGRKQCLKKLKNPLVQKLRQYGMPSMSSMASNLFGTKNNMENQEE